MENAIDALKMAFAVLIFVIALSMAIMMFSQLNDVSEVVLATSDITQYYEYTMSEDVEKVRVVGLETIIPTLYKYYKENYTVIFLNEDGTPLELYKSQTDINLWGKEGIIGKYYKTEEAAGYDKMLVCSFDVDEETLRHEPWTGSPQDFKLNLDMFLQGGFFRYPSGALDESGKKLGYNYGNDSDEFRRFCKKGREGIH